MITIKNVTLSLLIFSVLINPAFGITWCHDYTVFSVTGEDANQTGPDQLRTKLKKDYKLAFTIQPGSTGGKLKPKDVIIIGNDHSGIVNTDSRIDHYLQPSGKKTTVYSPQEILSGAASGKMNNLFHGDKAWTIADIRDYHYMLKKYTTPEEYTEFPNYPYQNQPIEVWRKKGSCENLAGNWGGDLAVDSVSGTSNITVGFTRSVLPKDFQVSQEGCDVKLRFNTNEITGTVEEAVATLKTKVAGTITSGKLTLEEDSLKVELSQSGNATVVSKGTFQR